MDSRSLWPHTGLLSNMTQDPSLSRSLKFPGQRSVHPVDSEATGYSDAVCYGMHHGYASSRDEAPHNAQGTLCGGGAVLVQVCEEGTRHL